MVVDKPRFFVKYFKLSMMILKLLEQLDIALQKKNAPLYSILKPPLTDAEIMARSKDLRYPLPEDVKDLYRWKNGTDDEKRNSLGELQMFSLNVFFPLDRLIDFYLNELGSIQDYPLETSHLFPIFQSGIGEQTFMDIALTSKTFGKIYYYSRWEIELVETIVSYADSLESLLASVIECYEKDIYYLRKGTSVLERLNDQLECAVFLKHNPNSDYWKVYSEIYRNN
jgi:hypothetical protein